MSQTLAFPANYLATYISNLQCNFIDQEHYIPALHLKHYFRFVYPLCIISFFCVEAALCYCIRVLANVSDRVLLFIEFGRSHFFNNNSQIPYPRQHYVCQTHHFIIILKASLFLFFSYNVHKVKI